MAPSPARLREATPADAEAFAAIAVEALADKYRPALGSAALAGATAVARRGIAAAEQSRYTVAEVDGRIAGVVHLALEPAADQDALSDVLAGAVGRLRALRAAVVFALLDPRHLPPGSAYVDELAVAPWARGRGIGRELLRSCVREAAAAGRSRVVLMVTADNAAALALYRSEGFETVRRLRWPVARWIFHAPGAHIMELPLPRR